MSAPEVDLESLVGLHKLSGVEFGRLEPKEEGSDASNTMTFLLDGKVYTAVENPDDGYRSSLRSLSRTGKAPANAFAPCKVFGLMRLSDRYGRGKADVLSFYDAVTAKLVLEVGTDNSDDYYPSCVMFFDPTAMAVNTPRT